ncbi:MAG TPA: ATP-binding protein [Verrucomicrobiota bacterium]|nr:ATP-binding protein [Verrucomicrobiota bacterium]HRT09484.1 ATP-binding protein [Candidatus Paceibacterota bacterium]HRT56632.1 ATP-binding protein [Candidatus Paceibacterota bacterium]
MIGTGALGWVGHRTASRLGELQGEFLSVQAETFYLGIRLRSGVERLNTLLLQFQLSKADPAERERFHQHSRFLVGLITQAKPHLATAEERSLVQELEAAFEQYQIRASPLLEKGVRAVRRDSAVEVAAQIQEVAQPLERLCDELIELQQASCNRFLGRSHQVLQGLMQSFMIILVLLILFAVTIGGLAYRRALAPLRRQLTRAQAVVERQEKLASLGTLAAGVAHEIRNPLASLKFRLFSLKESLRPELSENEDLIVIDDEINRLERIVKDFLQFARPAEPVLAKVEADQLLRRVRDVLEPQLAARGIQLVVEAGEPVWLKVDSQQIQQVLINLAQNAADSIENSGRITLRARRGAARLGNQSRPAVLLEVADTGKGIPPDVQRRLFDPFFSTKSGGTGLGLSIAERVVEMHGGLIQYQTQLNRGTTFQIVLPQDTANGSQHSPH